MIVHLIWQPVPVKVKVRSPIPLQYGCHVREHTCLYYLFFVFICLIYLRFPQAFDDSSAKKPCYAKNELLSVPSFTTN